MRSCRPSFTPASCGVWPWLTCWRASCLLRPTGRQPQQQGRRQAGMGPRGETCTWTCQVCVLGGGVSIQGVGVGATRGGESQLCLLVAAYQPIQSPKWSPWLWVLVFPDPATGEGSSSSSMGNGCVSTDVLWAELCHAVMLSASCRPSCRPACVGAHCCAGVWLWWC